jgi:hypothetical protein
MTPLEDLDFTISSMHRLREVLPMDNFSAIH